MASSLTMSTELKIRVGFSLIYQTRRSRVRFSFSAPTHCRETALSICLSLHIPLVFNEYPGECDVRTTRRVYFRKSSDFGRLFLFIFFFFSVALLPFSGARCVIIPD